MTIQEFLQKVENLGEHYEDLYYTSGEWTTTVLIAEDGMPGEEDRYYIDVGGQMTIFEEEATLDELPVLAKKAALLTRYLDNRDLKKEFQDLADRLYNSPEGDMLLFEDGS